MTRAAHHPSTWLLSGAVGFFIAACLPLLALVLWVTRAAALAAAVGVVLGAVAAALVSPRFRSWFRTQSTALLDYKGLHFATDVAAHPYHSWARIDPDAVRVGADDLVQAVLGPIDAVDVPRTGRRVQAGEPILALRHGARRVTLPSPVSGTVLGTNQALRAHPEIINRDPFGEGWAVCLGNIPPEERSRLLRGRSARAWFQSEVDRLINTLARSDDAIPTYADGGTLVEELHRHVPREAWTELRTTFFGMQDDEQQDA